MSVISPREFREALLDWIGGKRVTFRDGWAGATTAGGWDARGVLHHWTAMSKSVSVARQLQVLRYGYSGLPGPLCHVAPARDGRLYVVGWGNTNHAGMGDPEVFRRVAAGRFDGTPEARQDTVDGNARLYGFEYMYHPDDGPMPDEQVEVGILANAAIAQAHGWDAATARGSCLDHYEWAARKWDREVHNLANRTREGVYLAVKAGPGNAQTTINTEDDMELTEKNLRDIAHAVWTHDHVKVPHNIGTAEQRERNPVWQPRVVLTRLLAQGADAGTAHGDLDAQVDTLAESLTRGLDSIASLAERIDDTDLTEEERAQLANDIASRVNRLRVEVNVTQPDVEG